MARWEDGREKEARLKPGPTECSVTASLLED